jgi:hypothetical protein
VDLWNGRQKDRPEPKWWIAEKKSQGFDRRSRKGADSTAVQTGSLRGAIWFGNEAMPLIFQPDMLDAYNE